MALACLMASFTSNSPLVRGVASRPDLGVLALRVLMPASPFLM